MELINNINVIYAKLDLESKRVLLFVLYVLIMHVLNVLASLNKFYLKKGNI